MAFWGVEVKPGKPFMHLPYGGKGRLHVSQATLGIGSATNKSIIVQCSVGKTTPVFLCSLFPGKTESCQLKLEFEEPKKVIFSVIGSRSVHITGFYVQGNNARNSSLIDDESEIPRESYGEDIRDTETDKSDDTNDYDTDDSFINDDDPEVDPPSPCLRNKVENRAADASKRKKSRRLKKKYRVISESESHSSGDMLPLPQNAAAVSGKGEVEEEEEASSDSEEAVRGFFMSLGKKKPCTNSKDKREVEEEELRKNKKDGVEKTISQGQGGAAMENNDGLPVASHEHKRNEPELDTALAEPKAKKKSKSEALENDMEDMNMETPPTDENIIISSKESVEDRESTLAWTLPDGLIIEEIKLGNPDGKFVGPGKKVSVHFTGKIKENGKVIDSNVGGEPLKFRLGSGEVMGGWDDGVQGM